MIIKDKKAKRELDRVPDVDKNGDPIYKIDDVKTETPTKRKEKDPNK